MTWKCIIENYAVQSSGVVGINAVYVNDVLGVKVPKMVLTAAGTLDGIKNALRNELATLQAIAVAADLVPGEIDLTVIDGPPDPATAADLFFANLNRYKGLLKAVEYGVLPSNDAEIAALLVDLVKDFDRSYVNLSRWG